MNKVYQVFITDEYNNNYLLGFYRDLDDSIEDINKFLNNDKYNLCKGDIREYVSTFGSCFDTSLYDILLAKFGEEIEDCNLDTSIYIRGFILDRDCVIDLLNDMF